MTGIMVIVVKNPDAIEMKNKQYFYLNFIVDREFFSLKNSLISLPESNASPLDGNKSLSCLNKKLQVRDWKKVAG